jgi:hypothetical protein
VKKVLCLSCLGFFTCSDGSCNEVTANNAVERWALKNAKKASAEEIIVAAVIQSFAKDFGDWESDGFSNPKAGYQMSGGLGLLTNKKKKVVIARRAQKKGDKYRFYGLTINDITISFAMSKLVVTHWEKVFCQVMKAKTVAERAKNEMDISEKAWNLAENLLGFERTETGALVPKETVK